MIQLKINEHQEIMYRKKDDSTTTRTIIPTTLPAKVVTALDVSDLDEQEIKDMQGAMDEYIAYKELAMKKLFNFQEWLEHTSSEIDPTTVKYRAFILDNIV